MKRIFFILILLFSINFFSLKLLNLGDEDYYYYYLLNNSYETQILKLDSEIIKNNIFVKVPIKYEKRLSSNYTITGGRYIPKTLNDSIFRNITLNNGEIINLGFESNFGNTFYAKFASDFTYANISYFLNENKSLYNLDDFTLMSLDFPKNSFMVISEKKYEVILGRNKLSYGPLENDLLLSSNSPYYDNLYIKYKGKNINYRFAFISSLPLLSKTEYNYMFENIKNFNAFRNDFFNSIEYKNNNFTFSINSLNHVGGSIPSPINIFLKSDTGLLSINGKLNSLINIYGEYAINYSNLKQSFGIGIDKVFDYKNILIRPYFEYYYISDKIYSDENPYKQLYFRSFELANNPGSRLFYDYPFGFKYGENSQLYSSNLIIANKNGYLKLTYDIGKNNLGKINNFEIMSKYNFWIGDLIFNYNNYKMNDKNFNSLFLSYMVNLDVII